MGFLTSLAIAVGPLSLTAYTSYTSVLYKAYYRRQFPLSGAAMESVAAGEGVPAFEDLRIAVTDKASIHAWWLPGEDGGGKTLLFLHGPRSTIEREARAEIARLHRIGVNVLYLDYRGYGTSSAAETTPYTAVDDAKAALGYLTGTRGIDRSQIWIGGLASGATVAAWLAGIEASTEGPQFGGLILVSPTSGLVDPEPFRGFVPGVARLRGAVIRRVDVLSRIGSVRAPVLIIAPTEDTAVIPPVAAAVYERANEPKRLRLVDGTRLENGTGLRVDGRKVVDIMAETIRAF